MAKSISPTSAPANTSSWPIYPGLIGFGLLIGVSIGMSNSPVLGTAITAAFAFLGPLTATVIAIKSNGPSPGHRIELLVLEKQVDGRLAILEHSQNKNDDKPHKPTTDLSENHALDLLRRTASMLGPWFFVASIFISVGICAGVWIREHNVLGAPKQTLRDYLQEQEFTPEQIDRIMDNLSKVDPTWLELEGLPKKHGSALLRGTANITTAEINDIVLSGELSDQEKVSLLDSLSDRFHAVVVAMKEANMSDATIVTAFSSFAAHQ